jgi:hypothetical protein
MKTSEALKLVGGLSKPSKMPGWAYGLPAKECKTGSKLVKVKGSTCEGCYALKGCYVFKVVQEAQYRRLASVKHELWTAAMALLINSKKSKYFRWHDSGDVQDEAHLLKIFAVFERQATSLKPRAASIKLQAASSKLPNNFSFVKFPETSVEGLY